MRFMEALSGDSSEETHVYFTGGATAVLYGWRESTIDVDIKLVPERDRLFRSLAEIKESLHVNVEPASPLDFIPVPENWRERSPFIKQVGRTFFHHFDPYAQALSKIERGHKQDLEDVRSMCRMGLVDTSRLMPYFEEIAPQLYRYPAIDARSFRLKVTEFVNEYESERDERT
jgi:hypothetical protein